MIDLRSDTLTMPTREMLSCMCSAPLGDAGRLDENGQGGDPTVNALEKLAAKITGMERAMMLSSGTIGNHVALLTHCKPGDKVLVDTKQHLYRTEQAAFSSRFGQLRPVFYHLTEDGYPDVEEIERLLSEEHPALLCIENTHNGAGGTFIPLDTLRRLRTLTDDAGVPIHMDGARLFNASISSQIPVETICGCTDSVMFCLSKGLGAPIGSMLCGSDSFIRSALSTRKLLGGNMRQAGVIAAAGQYALEQNIPLLETDHQRAKRMCALLQGLKRIKVPPQVQSNMILLDVSGLGLTAEEFVVHLKERGVWLSQSGDTLVRIVLYKDISEDMTQKAAEIIFSLEQEMSSEQS